MEIELQDYVRSKLKEVLADQKERRKYLYQILGDESVNQFIKDGEFDEAKNHIDNLIRGLN